jgi:transcriptional regulator with XRE-family HTH domain
MGTYIVNFDGEKARAIRLRKGMTLRAVCERGGFHIATLCGWEKGRSRPAADTIADLARALAVKPSALTTDGGKPVTSRNAGLSYHPGETMDQYICRLVEQAPPLSAETRSKLAALLNVP